MSFESWKWFLFLTLACLITQGFFAMLEMACVSFNKVRLQYYVSKNKKRAIWLSYLINHPALLFGSTLIMVNAALLIGSECSRKLYDSLGLSPDWAPLTQVFLVLIFAEISPMFAGRRYAEHAAMVGVPILYFCAMVLKPFIYLLDVICRYLNKITGSDTQTGIYLTREELQNVIEEREENFSAVEKKDQFDAVIANIFSLKNKIAKEVMTPLSSSLLIPDTATIKDLRFLLSQQFVPYVPVFHKTHSNITGIIYPRDLLRLSDEIRVKKYVRSAWFLTEATLVVQILKQFRKNNQSISVVLDDSGQATGILTLDDIIDTIFGRTDNWISTADISPRAYHVVLDKTLPGDMMLNDFNEVFKVHLAFNNAKTLADVVVQALGHAPSKGESVRVDQFELTVEEASLIAIKTVSVRTVY